MLFKIRVGLCDTFDVFRIINDEVSIPHHREIHRQLTDSQAFIQILQTERERKRERVYTVITFMYRIYSLLHFLLNFIFSMLIIDCNKQPKI